MKPEFNTRAPRFTDYVRRSMKLRGQTMQDTADLMGVSRESLSNLLNKGPTHMRVSTMLALATALGEHPRQLLEKIIEDGCTETPLPKKLAEGTRRPGWSSTFVDDVTYPDHSMVAAGATFTKTWAIQNNGTVIWEGCSLKCCDEFLTVTDRYGHELNSMQLIPSCRIVAIPTTKPGDSVEISVEFTAPLRPATYISYWKLIDANGEIAMPDLQGLSCLVRVGHFK